MGVHQYATTVISKLPPAEAFKALVNFIHIAPKAAPHIVQSVEGNNEPGSVKQINFAQGRKYKVLKQRVEEVNYERLIYRFTIIDGDVITDEIEKIEIEIKVDKLPEGGSILQGNSKYYTKGDAELNHDEIKVGKENSSGFFKHIESYISAQA